MTEDEARAWLTARFPAKRLAVLERFLGMVIEENDRQNLISPASVSAIWTRHAVDSAQLIGLVPAARRWTDIGTGGGFPGMVVAILADASVRMVEPRRRRVEFLQHCCDELGLAATVELAKIETIDGVADVISARAVASIEKLLQAARHCATASTRWILPRGQIAPDDLSMLQQRRLMFHVEHSITDQASSILVIEGRP